MVRGRTASILLLLLSLAGWCLAQAGTRADAQAEPPDPEPSPAVRRLLDEATAHEKARRFEPALEAAERGIAAARDTRDAPGEASSLRLKAFLLEQVDRVPEAITAWREAAAAWERAGDSPGRIEALGFAAALLLPARPELAHPLLDQARALAQSDPRRPEGALLALYEVGRRLRARGLPVQARDCFLTTLAGMRKRSPEGPEVAVILGNLGSVAYDLGDLKAAVGLLTEALALQEKVAPDSPELAVTLISLGLMVQAQAEYDAALKHYQRALAILEKRAPDSTRMAAVLNNLGTLAWDRGDLDGALAYQKRALAIWQKLAPDSPSVATGLNNVGAVARARGDIPAAEEYHRRALEILERRAPGSPAVAATLNHLGAAAQDREDPVACREYYLRALSILEKLAPGSVRVADLLNNLGLAAHRQGDVAGAADYYRRALAINQAAAPRSVSTATNLNNLGVLATDTGDLAAALDYHGRASVLQEQLAPGSLQVADSLINLGNVHARLREGAKALDAYRRGLALYEKQAPGSLRVAAGLASLGSELRAQGDTQSALEHHRRALEIREKLAPESRVVALSLRDLGAVLEARGERAEAEAHYRRAWGILRRQAGLVSGDEARRAFEASYRDCALALIRIQVRAGKGREALATVEESRAQALRQLLAERGLDLRSVPPELATEYRVAVRAWNRAEQAVGAASLAEVRARTALAAAGTANAPADERERLRAALAECRMRFEAAQSAYVQARLRAEEQWAKVQKGAGRSPALPPPPPEPAKSLPRETLYAAFSVGQRESSLFLLAAGETVPRVYPLSLSEEELEKLASRFAAAAARQGLEVAALGRSLFPRLFPGDAAARILAARRLLLSPDGALWHVPFAALVVNAQGAPRYLGLQKPLAYTPSLAVLAQARAGRSPIPPGRRPQALVLGNPRFTAPGAPGAARSAVGGERAFLLGDGHAPAPLPGTAAEAAALSRLYGAPALTGEQATEAAVRARIGTADVVHLATHGFLHPRRPMSSGVLLALPEAEPAPGESAKDGVLQAWEIFSELRLKAELVALSACETGGGETVRGEGIVGLTRALQYAGARSVVASRWKVADGSTSALMVRFHEELRGGAAKDEALRRAMAAVQGAAKTAHPYYWAAFCLTGDPDNPGLGR